MGLFIASFRPESLFVSPNPRIPTVALVLGPENVIICPPEDAFVSDVKACLATDFASLNSSEKTGMPALSLAITLGYKKAVNIMMDDERIDIDAQDVFGETALDKAIHKGELDVAEWLLLKLSPAEFRRSFFEHRIIFTMPAIHLINVSLQADPRKRHMGYRTPLSWAAETGELLLVKKLLFYEFIDSGCKDFAGRTALARARENQHHEIADLIFYHQLGATPPEAPLEQPRYLEVLWHIITFLVFLARRLQVMAQFNLSFGRLSEFPNRLRPPCTTMPWNIRPALLVLWGVCWMFYYGSNATQPEQQYTLKDYVLEDTTTFDDSFDNNFDPSWAPLITSLDPLVNTFPSIPFPRSTTSSSFPSISPLQIWTHSLTGIPGSLDNGQFLDSFAFQALEPVAQQQMQYIPGFGDAPQDGLQQEATPTVLPVDDILRSSTYRGNVIIGGQPSESGKNTDSTIPTSGHGIVVADEPPRNPEGDIICDRAECANAMFAQKSAWKAHMDRQHNRPYRCEEQGCKNHRSYGSKGELKRHVDRVHKQIQHPCPVAGCSYACSRKDNLRDHVNRQHRHEFSKQAPVSQEARSSPSAERIDVVATSVEHMAPTVEVEERPSVSRTRKRRRGSGGSSSPSRTHSQSEDQHDLVEENKRLRKENEGLKRELELAKKRESTFFTLFDASRRNPE